MRAGGSLCPRSWFEELRLPQRYNHLHLVVGDFTLPTNRMLPECNLMIGAVGLPAESLGPTDRVPLVKARKRVGTRSGALDAPDKTVLTKPKVGASWTTLLLCRSATRKHFAYRLHPRIGG